MIEGLIEASEQDEPGSLACVYNDSFSYFAC